MSDARLHQKLKQADYNVDYIVKRERKDLIAETLIYTVCQKNVPTLKRYS